MSRIRAIFFDIDGTLVSLETHRIPASTVRALELARAQDIGLFVATGRPLWQADHIRTLGFDGFVTFNGQLCRIGERTVRDQPLDSGDIARLVEYLTVHPDPVLFAGRDGWSINFIDDRVLEARERLGFTLPAPGDLDRICREPIYQLLYFVDVERLDAPLRLMPHCQSTRWTPLFADIIPREGGKHSGVAAVLSALNIAPQEAIAFGDGENDLTMFEAVGRSVAMGSASERVKAAADRVTAPVDEDGIWKALVAEGVIPPGEPIPQRHHP